MKWRARLLTIAWDCSKCGGHGQVGGWWGNVRYVGICPKCDGRGILTRQKLSRVPRGWKPKPITLKLDEPLTSLFAGKPESQHARTE